jgi:hypothetical protein
MAKQPFEKAWREAFQDQEKQPPAHLWNSLATELANAEATRSRKRAIFFQWLAAASVVFAMGLVFWNLNSNTSVQPIAANQQAAPAATTPTGVDSVAPVRSPASSGNSASGASANLPKRDTHSHKSLATSSPSSASVRKKVVFQQQALAFLERSQEQTLAAELPVVAEPDAVNSQPVATPLGATSDAKETTPELQTTQTPLETALIVSEEQANQNKRVSQPLWTSVGFAGGGFNTNVGTGATLQASTAYDFAQANGLRSPGTATSRQERVGTAFSFGLGVGKAISKRWSWQTGLVYMQQALNYSTNVVDVGAGNAASRAFLAESLSGATFDANLALTAPYQLQANLNYLSLPLLAGYTVLNRKFSIQLNGGVATDVLVQSNWQDRSGQFKDNRQTTSDVYRAMNWAGLLNTEFSYQLGKHYRASLVPGLRYSLQPIYRTEVNNNLRPFIWDVGFRLKYQF